MSFKNSKLYSFFTDIPESIFRTPPLKYIITYQFWRFVELILLFLVLNAFIMPSIIKFYTPSALFLCQKHLNSGLGSLVFGRFPFVPNHGTRILSLVGYYGLVLLFGRIRVLCLMSSVDWNPSPDKYICLCTLLLHFTYHVNINLCNTLYFYL